MANEKNTAMTALASTPPAQIPRNNSERFTEIVIKQFGSCVGVPQVTEYQKRLIQGYFISIDRALKMAEDERLRKNEKNRDHKFDNNLPVCWENVNSLDLALDVVHYARMGLDMMQKNHLFPIPYKNNKTQKYDVTLMQGYNGIRYIAEKYAVEKPAAVTIELVFSTDTFKPIKKSYENKVESYRFVINQPFDRGEVVGGFGYIEYADPARNELVIMARKDILKRKPQYASANFWGGKQGDKDVEVWFEEMCLKTLIREIYSEKHIPRDPQKIDDAYQYMKRREAQMAELEAQEEIAAYANGRVIDTTPELPVSPPVPLPEPAEGFHVDPDTGEVTEMSAPPTAPETPQTEDRAVNTDGQQTMPGGPDF